MGTGAVKAAQDLEGGRTGREGGRALYLSVITPDPGCHPGSPMIDNRAFPAWPAWVAALLFGRRSHCLKGLHRRKMTAIPHEARRLSSTRMAENGSGGNRTAYSRF